MDSVQQDGLIARWRESFTDPVVSSWHLALESPASAKDPSGESRKCPPAWLGTADDGPSRRSHGWKSDRSGGDSHTGGFVEDRPHYETRRRASRNRSDAPAENGGSPAHRMRMAGASALGAPQEADAPGRSHSRRPGRAAEGLAQTKMASRRRPFLFLGAGTGFEPVTFRL